jgi:hypothetical protein
MQPQKVIRFTETEAKEKLGRRVHALVEFAGVPRGTLGEVVDIYEFAPGEFDVFIQWESPLRKRVRDRFAKGPYEDYLREEQDEFAYAS